jgi:mono/diheme cytochrome c family protein
MRLVNHRLAGLGAVVLSGATLAACSGADSPGTTAGSPGERLFVETGCGSCHTFERAGTTGRAGPDLDGTRLTAAAAAAVIRNGAAGMPGYADGLSEAEIREVASFLTSP